MSEDSDVGSLVIIAIAFIFFTIEFSIKGFAHDLLLETGVLLVSTKLIVMAYKNCVTSEEMTPQ